MVDRRWLAGDKPTCSWHVQAKASREKESSAQQHTQSRGRPKVLLIENSGVSPAACMCMMHCVYDTVHAGQQCVLLGMLLLLAHVVTILHMPPP
jgi:hypothetical protein